MPLIVLRIFFFLSVLAVCMSYVERAELPSAWGVNLGEYRIYLIIGAVILGGAVIAIDLTIPRKSLQALAGVFFGLMVGLLITFGITLVLDLLVSAYIPSMAPGVDGKDQPPIAITKVLVGIVTCYLCVSFILQTKDDIRFVIPYVEFSKQLKGQRPLLLDTSVIIDGRIADICETGIIDQQLVVPKFVLTELQTVADSADKLKRNRGRRGLDVLQKLQNSEKIDIEVVDANLPKHEAAEGVDLKLVSLARQINGRIATNDYNLNKVARLRDIDVININDLANALKPVVLPGEAMQVKIIKPGEEAGQGIGYLDDGTMVVVEQGRGRIGERVPVSVTSVLQTSAGRMIFGRIDGAMTEGRGRREGPNHA